MHSSDPFLGFMGKPPTIGFECWSKAGHGFGLAAVLVDLSTIRFRSRIRLYVAVYMAPDFPCSHLPVLKSAEAGRLRRIGQRSLSD